MIVFNGYPVKICVKANIKNISIRFKENTFYISCPRYTSEKIIENLLKKNKKALDNIVEKYKEKSILEEEKYANNSIHKIWGNDYFLKIYKDSKNTIKVVDKEIIITLKNITALNVKKELEKIYRKELQHKITEIVPKIKTEIRLYPNEIRIKNMRTRWGTCNIKDKRIWINLQLVKYDEECLRCVLIHEFIHLEIKNHDKKFYEKLYKYCPEYKKIEKILNNF